jgi:hypothetical protein
MNVNGAPKGTILKLFSTVLPLPFRGTISPD